MDVQVALVYENVLVCCVRKCDCVFVGCVMLCVLCVACASTCVWVGYVSCCIFCMRFHCAVRWEAECERVTATARQHEQHAGQLRQQVSVCV